MQTKIIVAHHSFATILQDKNSKQLSLHSTKAFKVGDVLSKFEADITQSYATYLTVQVGLQEHITLKPTFLQYINHSCSPSVFFDTTSMLLIALKNIEVGDEFTFFYPSTEWDMAQPFVCNCRSENCLQIINGARHISISTINKYKLTNFIQQQLQYKKQGV